MSIAPVTTGCTVNICAAPRVVTKKVVDTDTLVPDTAIHFAGFGDPSECPTGEAFHAFREGGGEGIYRAACGPPYDALVDTNTTVPGTDEPFLFFSGPSYSDRIMTFVAAYL